MWEASCKGRSIIKSILWPSFGELHGSFEGIDLIPILQSFLLLLRKVDLVWKCLKG